MLTLQDLKHSLTQTTRSHSDLKYTAAATVCIHMYVLQEKQQPMYVTGCQFGLHYWAYLV